MKLSNAQSEIISLMLDGWELGLSTSGYVGAWVQRGGVGAGGTTKRVKINTFLALRDRGLIEKKYERFPTSIYRLTDKARALCCPSN